MVMEMERRATTFIHLTDLHIQASATDRFFGLDTMAKLHEALAFLRRHDLLPGAPIIISGDLVHDGARASYARLRGAVEELRDEGVTVLLGLGNHDDRVAFRAEMLGESAPDPMQGYYYREMLGDVRLIMLDPHIPGSAEGTIDDAQLDWLAAELATPAPGGTVVVIHHPPFPAALSSMHNLTNGDRLRAVIAGTDVCGILAGHQHKMVIAIVAGVPCVAAPGTAFLLDGFKPDGYHFQDGAMFTVVTVREGALELRPIASPSAPEVAFRSWEEMRAAAAAHAVQAVTVA